jgi:hypothetical protein
MTPGQWVSLALLFIGVSWLVGVFIEIANGKPPRRTKEQIDADVEDMLKQANNEVTDRPRVRAITEPLLHREKNL